MYKQHKVIMLPTETPSKIILENNILKYHPSKISVDNVKYKELYIISDDCISINDWVIDLEDNILFQVTEQKSEGLIRSKDNSFVEQACRKVIATTDKSLGIDNYDIHQKEFVQITKSFIEQFVESNGTITDVEVEYEDMLDTIGEQNHLKSYPEMGYEGIYKIKVSKNNEVIIKPSNKLDILKELTKIRKDLFDAHNRKDLVDVLFCINDIDILITKNQ